MINGSVYRSMIVSAANNIANLQDEINKLNVFPVPDGDTGTNMSLTMQAGKNAVEHFSGNLTDCAEKVSSALLRGGRGNSGVILSLFFRGVTKELKGLETASPSDFAKAFRGGVESAYKAVRKPTEGTVLTVMRLCADRAEQLASSGIGDAEFFAEMLASAKDTLAKTPDMLPTLKQANVVDAGGKGFCVLLEGMLAVLDGKGVIEAQSGSGAETEQADFASFNTEDIKFAYCTECIVNKDPKKHRTEKEIDAFREFIMNCGDSGVFIDDDDFIKFHIHTNDPGKVLSKCLKYGVLAKVKVENMKEQHTQLSTGESVENAEENSSPVSAAPEKKYGFVCVAAGDGIKAVFEDLGADKIVSGGQTMNPSTEDIIEAVCATPSEVVFVLPNNKNIYMSAKQAEEIVTDKKVVVLHTVSIPQGISAMLAFDPDIDVEENENAMVEAKRKVISESVTFAARDSVFDGHEIKEGQRLGLVNGKVTYIENSDDECIEKLSEDIKGSDYVTVFYGEGIDEEQAEKTADIIRGKLSEDAEVVVINGGQPVYYYMISAE